MISKEVLAKIQKLHFKTRRQANSLFAGQYSSAFKGRGMEFAEVREYSEGDDIRSIDWNVSARFGHPFVKQFHEERELTVILMVDLSGSHRFGTTDILKKDLLAEISAMLAFLAVKTNDRVGAVLFSNRVEKFIPPRKGASHVWRLIKEIYTFVPDDRRTNISSALEFLNRSVKRHSVVFLISDCIDTGFHRPLKLAARKHDFTILRIRDRAEEELPDAGPVAMRDPESGKTVIINTSSRDFRRRWAEDRYKLNRQFQELTNQAGVDSANLYTDENALEVLMRLFEKKGKKAW